MTCGTGPWRNVATENSPRSAEDPPATETTLTTVCASPAKGSPRSTPATNRCRTARTVHGLRNHAEFISNFLLVETSYHYADRTERITIGVFDTHSV